MLDESNPHNPCVISMCLSFPSHLTRSWLESVFIKRMLTHPRFRASVIRHGAGRLRYQLVPDFSPNSADLWEHHVTFEDEISPENSFELRRHAFLARLNNIISTPLDKTRPLWALHIFNGWAVDDATSERPTESATMVIRIHHSVGDGIGLVKYFTAVVADKIQANGALADILVPPRRHHAQLRLKAAGDAQAATFTASLPVRVARTVCEIVMDLCKIYVGTLIPDKKSIFTRADIQSSKVCAVLPPSMFSVEVVKAAARGAGVTINDLLLSAVAGASREYIKQHGDDPDTLAGLRFGIPFNQHALTNSLDSDVSNNVSIIAVNVPVHVESREARLQQCASAMQRIKGSYQLQLTVSAFKVVQMFPAPLRKPLWRRLTQSTSAIFSNVPGPRKRLTIGGIDVVAVNFWAPADGHAGVMLSVFSYDGRISIGVAGDEKRIEHPQRFVDLIAEELNALIALSKSTQISTM